jgi:hypothetical protein
MTSDITVEEWQSRTLSYAQGVKKIPRIPPDETVYPGQERRKSLTLCLVASATYIYGASKRIRFVFQFHAQRGGIKCVWQKLHIVLLLVV